jgi:hypothetical protein
LFAGKKPRIWQTFLWVLNNVKILFCSMVFSFIHQCDLA